MTEGDEGCTCKMSFSSVEAFNDLIDHSKPGMPVKNPVQVLTFLLGPFTKLTDRLNAVLRPSEEAMQDRAFFEKSTTLTLYTIAEAIPLKELVEAQDPGKYLRDVDTMFSAHPAVTLTPNQEKRCRNGNAFSVNLEPGTYRAYGQNGEFLMLAQVDDGVMSTKKSFFEV